MPIINSESADSFQADNEIFIDDGYDTSETKSQKTTVSEISNDNPTPSKSIANNENIDENLPHANDQNKEILFTSAPVKSAKAKRKKKHKNRKPKAPELSNEILIDEVKVDTKHNVEDKTVDDTNAEVLSDKDFITTADEVFIDQVQTKEKSKPTKPVQESMATKRTDYVNIENRTTDIKNVEEHSSTQQNFSADLKDSKSKTESVKSENINLPIQHIATKLNDDQESEMQTTKESTHIETKDTIKEIHAKKQCCETEIKAESEKPQSLSISSSVSSVELHHNFSAPSSMRNLAEKPMEKSRRKVKSFFLGGRRRTETLAAAGIGQLAKHPSPRRLLEIYTAVRKGTSDYISMNTAELNVLLNKKKETGRTAHLHDIQKKIKRLERLIKALHFHVSQLDNLYEEYNLESRYKEGAEKLRSALNSSPVSSRTSRSSVMVAKADLACSVENMCQIERDFTDLLGFIKIEMKGLLGFARLKTGDQYEMHFKYGLQKWKIKGSVKSAFDQEWDQVEHTIQPLLTDFISIKLMEVKLLGKLTCIGNVSCETEDLFSAEPQDLAVNLNDTGSLKLGFRVTWSPFEFSDGASTLTYDGMRNRTKSVVEHPNPVKKESTSPRARPMSAMFLSYNFSNNNNNSGQIPFELQNDEIESDLQSIELSEADEKTVMEDKEAFLVQSKVKKFEEEEGSTPVMTGHRQEEEAFLSTLRDNAQAAMEAKKEDVPELADLKDIEAALSHAREVGMQLLALVTATNQMMDDFRGSKIRLRKLESVIQILFEKLQKTSLSRGHFISNEEENAIDSFSFLDSQMEDTFSIKDSEFNDADTYIMKYTPELITCGHVTADEAIISHLNIVQDLLKDVGTFRPMQVREIIAIDRLSRQAFIIESIMETGALKSHPELEDITELSQNRTLMELWRSCCDGHDKLCVKAKTLKLELESEFGREIGRKHPDVANKVFDELVHRIIYKPSEVNIDDIQVTVFQLSNFVDDSIIQNEGDELEKIIDKLALELFVTQTLQSGIQRLVLIAIKRVSSLLALKTSNLCALSHLLLDKDQKICTAAAAHIKDIATDTTLRQKAIVSYAGLLETHNKRDKKCACVALGFLGAKECIPQLTYLCAVDTHEDVRDAARHSLTSFGEEGILALEHADSSLLSQTMTYQVSVKNHARMGVAL